jgi:protein tyrosine phosphatase (PTP) superfamily phosphohydrolase (DUF442 family)
MRVLAAFGLAVGLAGASCTAPSREAPADPTAAEVPGAAATAPSSTLRDVREAGETAGILNMAEIAPGLLRGAQPEGDASFALLASLGVRTILSVDGARPDVEGAEKHGLRYVHIPVEYSGFTRAEQVRIARVAKEHDGGLFVHCHHGKHRGPAASAIAWMAIEGCPSEKAVADMKRAGTDPRYEGLYADVREFRPVTAEELAAVKPEEIGSVAHVPDFIEAMVRIDVTFDRMKAVKQAGWKTPESMPDVRPAHEARILAEHFREAARLEEAKGRPEVFRTRLGTIEQAAWDLETSLRDGAGDAASAAAFDRVAASCAACHDVYRNRKQR